MNATFIMPSGLIPVLKTIKQESGKAFLVGGGVIEAVKGDSISNDWDIEIYGLSFQQLLDILTKYGEPNLVGKSFGVIKLKLDNIDYDFSIPRLESRTGVTHKDFDVTLKSDLTPEEAARRRDITINAMLLDLDTGEIIDPYNGLEDLDNGWIRAVDKKTFIEDPLRVLRIMQLLPRKGVYVCLETLSICRDIFDEYGTIPKERVFEEFKKLLLLADVPSTGFQFLRDCKWIKHFHNLDAMQDVPQHPEWHPEGSVWNHTMAAIDIAANIREFVPEEWKLAFMFGMLLHDVGKIVTTGDDLTAHGHDKAGVDLARSFMLSLTDNKDLTQKVLAIVANHMRVGQLYNAELVGITLKPGAWKRLHQKLPLNIAAAVERADYCSRGNRTILDESDAAHLASKWFIQIEEENTMHPILMGRHLIAKGMQPGPVFGKILKAAYVIQIDEGITDVDELYNAAIAALNTQEV